MLMQQGGLTKSIPQANPGVQTISGLPDRKGNGNQPFAFPSPSVLVTNSQGAWFGELPLQVVSWTPAVIQVGGLWLFQETVQSLKQASWSRSPLDIARAVVIQGLNRM